MEKKPPLFGKQTPHTGSSLAPREPIPPPATYTKAPSFSTTATATLEHPEAAASSHKRCKARVVVHYDVGFSNQIFIRGNGNSLSWSKGIPLKNIKPDEWVWETDADFTSLEFKVLVNDECYEKGDNHLLKSGTTFDYTPLF